MGKSDKELKFRPDLIPTVSYGVGYFFISSTPRINDSQYFSSGV